MEPCENQSMNGVHNSYLNWILKGNVTANVLHCHVLVVLPPHEFHPNMNWFIHGSSMTIFCVCVPVAGFTNALECLTVVSWARPHSHARKKRIRSGDSCALFVAQWNALMNKNHLANHMPSHTYYQPRPSSTAGKRVGLRETRLCSAKGRMALSCVLCTGAVPRSTARRRLYGDSSVQVLNELKRATLAGGWWTNSCLMKTIAHEAFIV